ncbi:MAG: cytidylate kinase-like family protein [Dehalococcoidales bacterium]|jgi:cytidylate kinase
MPVITIRGQFGSGAPDIGKKVAERLHIDYVDREIIAGVAEKVNATSKKIEAKEMPPATFFKRIGDAIAHAYPIASPEGLSAPIPVYLPASQIPLDDPSYLRGLESVVKELAAGNAIVIRGRGSQFILKDFPGVFHVMVVAPLKLRVDRIMSIRNLDEKAARQEINSFDSSRHEFIKRFFKEELENPLHYDLVINTEHFNLDEAASLIIDALSVKNP